MSRQNSHNKAAKSDSDLVTHLHNHETAQSSTSHWLWQRLTSLLLVGLMLWFVIALFALRDAKQNLIVIWMAQPVNTALLIATIGLGMVHAVLGMQVIIEDYIHNTTLKLLLRLTLFAVFGFLGLLVLLALLRVSALVTVLQAVQAG